MNWLVIDALGRVAALKQLDRYHKLKRQLLAIFANTNSSRANDVAEWLYTKSW